MKTLFLILALTIALISNSIVAQPVYVTEGSFPADEYSTTIVLLGNEILTGYEGMSPSYYYNGTVWKTVYYAKIGIISGVKNSSGDIIAYTNSTDNFFRWNNTLEKWDIVANRPSIFQNGGTVYVKDENNIYLLSGGYSYPKLMHYDGNNTFTELYTDSMSYHQHFLLEKGGNIFFARGPSSNLMCYNIALDTAYVVVNIPNIENIRDVKSIDGVNLFILSEEGNLYRYNMDNQILVNLVICDVDEQNKYEATLAVASNRLLFLGGTKGIQKITIADNGDAFREVIYTINNPDWYIYTSSVDGNKAVFTGKFTVNGAMGMVTLNFTTGVVESTLANINIYPNPTSGLIKIDGLTEVSDIQIFDIAGKLIFQKQYQPDDDINISDLNPGMYIINVRNSQGVFSSKIIKQ